MAYIDLNPLRAGIVKSPDDYRWCSLGYHLQKDNRDGVLSFDFGLEAFGNLDREERLSPATQHVGWVSSLAGNNLFVVNRRMGKGGAVPIKCWHDENIGNNSKIGSVLLC